MTPQDGAGDGARAGTARRTPVGTARMRLRSVADEAWRNVASGTTHTLRYALVLTVVAGALVVADLVSVTAVLSGARTWQQSGASTLTLAAEGRIDAAGCEALADLPGVRAAGALAASDGVVAAALPRSSVPTIVVSPGALALFDVTADVLGPGVLLSDQAASALGLSTGGTLSTTSGSAPVRGTYTYPDDGRRPGYSYAALVPSAAQRPFDECWVDAFPAPQELSGLLRTVLLPSGDQEVRPPVLSQLNTTLGTQFDGRTRYDERPTRHAPVAAALAGLALGCAAIRARRLELASALHSGVARADQLTQLLGEASTWIAAAWVLALPVPTALVLAAPGDGAAAIAGIALQVMTAASVGVLAGVAVAAALTRERHLFVYFKNR